MSAVKPYYLLSQSQLSHFETWLQSILSVLAKRWWSDISQIQVTARACTPDDALAEKSVRQIYQRDDSYLLVCGSGKHWINAVSGWLGCEVDQSSPLTKELEGQYCKELVASMDQAWNPCTSPNHLDVKKIIATYSQPGHGGIAVEVTINNFSHMFLTAAAAFPLVFEAKDNPTDVSLVNVANALHATAVTLEARLAAVKVPLLNVSTMRVGDFIDLQHNLSGEILLDGVSADISFKAELGQRENNKAAQITSVNRK